MKKRGYDERVDINKIFYPTKISHTREHTLSLCEGELHSRITILFDVLNLKGFEKYDF